MMTLYFVGRFEEQPSNSRLQLVRVLERLTKCKTRDESRQSLSYRVYIVSEASLLADLHS